MLYQSKEHGVELKLSRHLPNCTASDHFLVFFLALFSLFKSDFSEQARRQIATEEPKKVCKHAERRNLCYLNVSRDENPQRENEMDEF